MSSPPLNNPFKPKVLLLYRRYASSFTAYPWIFGRTGNIEVHTLAPSSHAIRHSRWVDRHYTFESEDGMIGRLLELLKEGAYHAILCVDEPSREILLENRDHSLIKPYLPFPENSALFEAAVNKVKFQLWCSELGLDSPKSRFCSTAAEVISAVGEFSYPFVIKGAHGAGGQQVHIVRDETVLESLISKLEFTASEEWIVQEYINGPVGTTLFVSRGGELYAHCSVINRVCMHGGIGPSAICEFIVDPELEKIALQLSRHVDGLTGVDWMRDEKGRFILIDPHLGRATPNAVIAHLDGVDFGEAFYQSLTHGKPALMRPHDSRVRVWLMPKSLNLIFEARILEALRAANPFTRGVRVFCGGRGEWLMFVALTSELLCGNLRVLFGRIRRRFFTRKSTTQMNDVISIDP